MKTGDSFLNFQERLRRTSHQDYYSSQSLKRALVDILPKPDGKSIQSSSTIGVTTEVTVSVQEIVSPKTHCPTRFEFKRDLFVLLVKGNRRNINIPSLLTYHDPLYLWTCQTWLEEDNSHFLSLISDHSLVQSIDDSFVAEHILLHKDPHTLQPAEIVKFAYKKGFRMKNRKFPLELWSHDTNDNALLNEIEQNPIFQMRNRDIESPNFQQLLEDNCGQLPQSFKDPTSHFKIKRLPGPNQIGMEVQNEDKQIVVAEIQEPKIKSLALKTLKSEARLMITSGIEGCKTKNGMASATSKSHSYGNNGKCRLYISDSKHHHRDLSSRQAKSLHHAGVSYYACDRMGGNESERSRSQTYSGSDRGFTRPEEKGNRNARDGQYHGDKSQQCRDNQSHQSNHARTSGAFRRSIQPPSRTHRTSQYRDSKEDETSSTKRVKTCDKLFSQTDNEAHLKFANSSVHIEADSPEGKKILLRRAENVLKESIGEKCLHCHNVHFKQR